MQYCIMILLLHYVITLLYLYIITLYYCNIIFISYYIIALLFYCNKPIIFAVCLYCRLQCCDKLISFYTMEFLSLNEALIFCFIYYSVSSFQSLDSLHWTAYTGQPTLVIPLYLVHISRLGLMVENDTKFIKIHYLGVISCAESQYSGKRGWEGVLQQ